MADFGTPIANQNQTSPIQTLSALLGIKQQQQALQGQAADVQQKQQDASQRAASANFFDNFDVAKHSGPDGTLDLNSAFSDPKFRGLGDAAPEVMQKLATIKNSQLDSVNKLASLNGTIRSQMFDLADGLQGDKDVKGGTEAGRQKVLDAFDDYSKSAVPEAQAVLQPYRDRLAQMPAQNLPMALKNMTRQNLTAGQLADRTLPAAGTLDNGGQVFTGTTDPTTGVFAPSGQAVTKVPAPAVATLPSGSLGVVGGVNGVPGGGNGGGTGAAAPPSKLQPLARPPANAPAADQANYQRQIQSAGQEYGAVTQAANDPMNGVQATRFRNQQILDIAPHATTGPGTRVLNTIASRLPGSSGDAYQDLEHYTAQNSAALAKLMGVPGTNMGAETAAAAAGNVERNPGALVEITRTNDALNTAMDLYNRGLAKVTSNGSDMSRAAAYKQAFGQNLDVNAVRWADAHRRGDQEEIKQLQQKFGPQGIAEFTKKLNVLKSLAGNGDLP